MTDLDLAPVLEKRLVGHVVDERVEEGVLRLDVGEQRLRLLASSINMWNTGTVVQYLGTRVPTYLPRCTTNEMDRQIFFLVAFQYLIFGIFPLPLSKNS